MQLTQAHDRDCVLTPAELPAALGIPPGPQEEAGSYISEPRRDGIYLNAPFGVIEICPGNLVTVAQA